MNENERFRWSIWNIHPFSATFCYFLVFWSISGAIMVWLGELWYTTLFLVFFVPLVLSIRGVWLLELIIFKRG